MALQVDSSRVGRIAVLKCSGRIVAGEESNVLHEHVRKLQPEYNHFVLHLGEVQFIDSTGIGLMVRLLSSVRSIRGDLKLCAVPQSIQTVLQLTKLSSMFEAHPDEEAALASFHHHVPVHSHSSAPSDAVLCVEKSSDLLAYLREVLRRAGYEPLTTTNLPDATVLLKSAKPRLVILGPGILATGSIPLESFRKAAASYPQIEVEPELAVREPAEAAGEILQRVQIALGKKTHAAQA